MAWTAPMTWVPNTALTAAQLNIHLRDNLMEMSTSKAGAAGQYFVASGRNKLDSRSPSMAVVNTSETTVESGEWVALVTPGPSVTAVTGTHCWLFYACESESSVTGAARHCSYEITGATAREPLAQSAIRQDGQQTTAQGLSFAQCDLISDLTPGENTFSLKYKNGTTSGATATFRNRRIIIWPL